MKTVFLLLSLYFFLFSSALTPISLNYTNYGIFPSCQLLQRGGIWGRIRYGLLRNSRLSGNLEESPQTESQHKTCLQYTSGRVSCPSGRSCHISPCSCSVWNANPSIPFPWIPACHLEPIWFSFSPLLVSHPYLLPYWSIYLKSSFCIVPPPHSYLTKPSHFWVQITYETSVKTRCFSFRVFTHFCVYYAFFFLHCTFFGYIVPLFNHVASVIFLSL